MLELDDILGSKHLGKKKCSSCNTVGNHNYFVPDLGYHSCPQGSDDEWYVRMYTESAYTKDTITQCNLCYRKDLINLKMAIDEQLKDILP